MWEVARRPRWIGMLLLALAVAAAFAGLSQWQIARSIEAGTVVERDTETPVPLEELTAPLRPVTELTAGHVVTVRGSFVPGEFDVISGRVQRDTVGFWLAGHLITDEGASLAVALGWAEDAEQAEAAAAAVPTGPVTLTGRYLPSESPDQGDFRAGGRDVLAVPDLINRWAEVDRVYAGFLVAHEAVAGLEAIHSPQPSQEVQVNWLNVFYAIEWVVFAGFAIYLWYRLVKDQYEREQELAGAQVPADDRR